MTLVSFMRSKQWPRLSRLESIVNRWDPAAWVCSKDLCGADDGDVVRQKKPFLGRLTSGNLRNHWWLGLALALALALASCLGGEDL